MSYRVVLLLREEASADPYRRELEASGLSVRFQPILRYEPVNVARLLDHLGRLDRYAGLILTSPRAVDILAEHEEQTKAWKRKEAYVVGPATAQAVAALGLVPRGEESGDGATLASYIIRAQPKAPLLFLSGTLRRESLPERLKEAGIAFDEVRVYETIARKEQIDLDGADWVIFFSPSGVQAADVGPAPPWNRLRLGAIGPTTADEITIAGLTAHAVASEPTPQALARAILDSIATNE